MNAMKKKEKFNFQDYNNDYKKKHYRRYVVMVPITETELLEKLEQEKNKNAYILQALKSYQEKN